MKNLIIILCLTLISISVSSQFVFNGGKATAKMDSIISNSNAITFRNKLTNSRCYLRTSGDSLFFGDVNGEKYMGDSGSALTNPYVSNDLFSFIIGETDVTDIHEFSISPDNLSSYITGLNGTDYAYIDLATGYLNSNVSKSNKLASTILNNEDEDDPYIKLIVNSNEGTINDNVLKFNKSGATYSNVDSSSYTDSTLVDKKWVVDRISNSGSVSSGDFLKAVGGSLVPYANQAEAPRGAFYWTDYDENNYLSIDTGIIITTIDPYALNVYSINGNAGNFNSTNSLGIGVNSIYSTGLACNSTYGTALNATTTHGYNHAIFGGAATGDTITIRSDGTIRQNNSGVIKLYTDTNGYIHNTTPHAFSKFMDSTITISLTQNTWYQITRPVSKTTWPTSEFIGFTDNGDTITAQFDGHYILKYQINLTGVDSKVYEYRIMRKNGTTEEVWRYSITGSGTIVLRDLSTYIDLEAGSKFWVEIRSTSSAPGDITIMGGQMRVYPIHLNL